MKNKLCTAILFMLFALPVFSAPEADMDAITEPMQEQEVIQEEEIQAEPQEDILPAVSDENISTPYKTPVSKKKIAIKFLLAMFGVVYGVWL